MVLVNGVSVDFDRAVNFLNFDKRGNPSGLDSLGVMVNIADNEANDLFVFIGLKFDVISVQTNRSASFFINLEEDKKQYLDGTYCSANDDDAVLIEFFVDKFKIELDIKKMYSYVYTCASSKEEFNTLLENKVFNTFGKKSARLISMHPTRQFEGNLELIGFVHSEDNFFFSANELLVEASSLAGEVRFTNWFVPRELEFYKYTNGENEFSFEPGDEFADGLAGIVLSDTKNINSFSYDRRGFRNGYMDLAADNPYVNVGFDLNGVEHTGNYFTRDKVVSDIDLKLSRFPISESSFGTWGTRLSQIVADSHLSGASAKDREKLEAEIFKYMVSDIFNEKGTSSWIEASTDSDVSSIISRVVDMSGNDNVQQEFVLAAEAAYKRTFIQFMFAGNIARVDTVLTFDDLSDSVVFIYHPVLKKYFFYEVSGVSDPGVSVSDGVITVEAHGFKYGIDYSGEHGKFIWSNVVKEFRNIPKELSFSREVINDPVRNYHYWYEDDAFVDNKNELGTKMIAFDDLTYEDNTAFVMVLKKVDLLDIISKQYGVCESQYAMGTKYGYMEAL